MYPSRIPTTEADPLKNVNNPSFYNNRELSWLDFNKRVLEESWDDRNTLLERYKFLAIFSSNLDEFFMVRVAGLQDQVKAGYNRPGNKAGLTSKEKLERISTITHTLIEKHDQTYLHILSPLLANENVKLITIEKASPSHLSFLENYFNDHIFPVLTPMAIDTYRPFPMLLNKSLNLGVVLGEQKFAIVQVPSVLTRYIELPSENGERNFVLLEQVMCHFIHSLFKGYEVKSVTTFRITRHADLTLEEDEAEGLLRKIEEELKKRKWGAPVRLEVQKQDSDSWVVDYLVKELEIYESDVYFVKAPLDLTFLFSFCSSIASTHTHLAEKTFHPQVPVDLIGKDTIFETALKQDQPKIKPSLSFRRKIIIRLKNFFSLKKH